MRPAEFSMWGRDCWAAVVDASQSSERMRKGCLVREGGSAPQGRWDGETLEGLKGA